MCDKSTCVYIPMQELEQGDLFMWRGQGLQNSVVLDWQQKLINVDFDRNIRN